MIRKLCHRKEEGKIIKMDKIHLHNENGITQLEINGTKVSNVSDYKIYSSDSGKTKLTFTIMADSFATDVEIDLVEG